MVDRGDKRRYTARKKMVGGKRKVSITGNSSKMQASLAEPSCRMVSTLNSKNYRSRKLWSSQANWKSWYERGASWSERKINGKKKVNKMGLYHHHGPEKCTFNGTSFDISRPTSIWYFSLNFATDREHGGTAVSKLRVGDVQWTLRILYRVVFSRNHWS